MFREKVKHGIRLLPLHAIKDIFTFENGIEKLFAERLCFVAMGIELFKCPTYHMLYI